MEKSFLNKLKNMFYFYDVGVYLIRIVLHYDCVRNIRFT